MDTWVLDKNDMKKELKRKVIKVSTSNAQDHLQNEGDLDSPTQQKLLEKL